MRTTTVRAFARRQLGWDPADPLSVADWLSFPSQQLLHVTAGPVHHDGVGELTRLRERLAWYPADLWRYLLAAGWTRLGQEEHLMGRAGYAGDELGSAVIGGRLARDLMALGFLLERRYAPYPKWFGTAFAALDRAPALSPLLAELVAAATWPERQDAYATAAGLLVQRQNALDLAAPVDPRPRLFHQRPFWVIDADRVAAVLVAAVTDPAVRRLTRRRLIGSVDQWSDSTDLKDAQYRAEYAGSTADVPPVLERAISSGVRPAGVRTVARASASTSPGGGKCGFGTATTTMPAVAAARSPLRSPRPRRR